MKFFYKGSFERSFQVASMLNSLAVLFVLAVYAYGGLFSRRAADDYCQSVYLAQGQNIFDAVLRAYNAWLNSYSILFFTQMIESAGIWGFRLMSGVTIVFWLASLVALFSQIGKALHLSLKPAVIIWLAGLTIFLSLYQAPALYEILYWRTSLIPYTLPIPFFVLIAAFVLWYARQPYQQSRAVWAGILCFALVFFASGLGETTSALQIGLLAVAVAEVWLTRSQHQRRDVLTILSASLVGAVISILIIGFSPGTLTRMDIILDAPPVYNPLELAVDVIVIASQFLWGALKSAPLPNLIALAIPFAVMYYQSSPVNTIGISPSRLRLAALIMLVFMFIVIGCSFAPGTFVRYFPPGRARFAAHCVLTLGLILEGGIGGILFSRFRLPVKTDVARFLTLAVIGLFVFYPLYASSKIFASIPVYQRFAADWDARDTFIRESVAAGAKDVTVIQLDSMEGIVEYKDNPKFWVNVCAAQYYGLDSIVAR